MTSPLLQAQINSRYVIQEKLGEGGMGAVYRATDRLTGDTIALKRVTLASHQLDFASRASVGESGNMRLALAQEFRVLSSLRHPHIISVLDYGFDADHQPYFTMDLLEGAQTLLQAGERQSVEAQVNLLIQVLQALAYLHRRSILHRDLKPANVLVNTQGQAKVLDFGLSATAEQAQGIAGTLAYMAPELLKNQSVSQATDLYAVGMMAYELLMDCYPFSLTTPSRLITHILTLKPDVSSIDNPQLADVVSRLLVKDPTARYSDADEVIRDLSAAIGQAPPQESIAIRESFLQAAQFIGRETELAQLTDALQNAMQGNGSSWLVGGESGVGKSRLMDELRTQALVEGVMVVRGQAVEGGGLPYQVWRAPLRPLVLSAELNDLEAGVLKDIVPDIGNLLGRDVPTAPELPGKAGQQRLALTIIDVFKRQPQPVLLILEDLQWATESLEFIRTLNRFVEGLPVLVVGNYRNDEQPDLPNQLPDIHLLQLARLSAAEVVKLSTSMLGEAGQQPEVTELLNKETEGNVFFLVEVVRALTEEAGQLSQVGALTLPEHVFTGGIQRIIQRRLDKIPAGLHTLSKLAAVLGREIDRAVLRQTAEVEQIEDWLITCANAAVLDVRDDRWLFAHDKLREALVADLSAEERPILHRQAAEAIEAAYPNDTAYHEVLMGHWRIAGNVARELHYLLPVVDDIIRLHAQYDRADALITRGLELIPPDDGRVVTLLNSRSESYTFHGEFSMARQVAEAACALAEKLAPPRELQSALLRLGTVANRQGDTAAARDYLQQSLALARDRSDMIGMVSALNALGISAHMQGDLAVARDYHQQSLTMAEALGDTRHAAGALNNLGLAVLNLGDYPAAYDLFRQAFDLEQKMGSKSTMGVSLNNIGNAAMSMGDYAGAQDYFQQALNLRSEIHDTHGIANSLFAVGNTFLAMDDNVKAQDYFQRSLALAREFGYKRVIMINLSGLGYIMKNLGNNSAAQDYFQQGLELARNSSPTDVNSFLKSLAAIAFEDQQSDFLSFLQEGLTLSLSLSQHPQVLILLVLTGRWAARKGDASSAARLAGLVDAHPACSSNARLELETLQQELALLLTAEQIATLGAEGAALDLETTAQEWLERIRSH